MKASLFLYVIGVFLLSWVAGFLFIITPGGLGIREASIVLLLKHVLPVPTLIIIAFYSRIVWTISEILSFIFAKIYKKR